jgi:hypothetical protein
LFRNLSSPLRNKKITAYWAMSVSLPTKWFLFHNFIPLSSQNIQVFEKHAQNLNTPQNSASWDLEVGFNLAFIGLKSTLILFSHLCLGLPSSLSLRSLHQNMHGTARP